jgi:uncharacterized protein
VSRVFFDSNLFIYLIEDEGEKGERVSQILAAMIERGDTLLTSTLTVGEVLVKPVANQNQALVDRYQSALVGSHITVIPFDRPAAAVFSQIRASHKMKPPDAIQLACAAVNGCDLFLTNDDRLSRSNVPGIQFIASLDRAPL